MDPTLTDTADTYHGIPNNYPANPNPGASVPTTQNQITPAVKPPGAQDTYRTIVVLAFALGVGVGWVLARKRK